jgi:SWI/SNF-related matrix-associated actin-dependent regulator of chromatin subfamily A3
MKVFLHLAPARRLHISPESSDCLAAHRIRNRASKTFEAVCKVSAKNHWCITGTPIQNSLDDYGALLAFVGVPPFATKDAFNKWIVRPFNSKNPDGVRTLRDLIAATCLRRTKAKCASALDLTRKIEVREEVEMSPDERQLYNFFKRRSYLLANSEREAKKKKGNTANQSKEESTRKPTSRGVNILVLIGLLRLICNHGDALIPRSALKAWNSRDASIINWDMLESGVRKCDSCDREIEDLENVESTIGEFTCGHVFCDGCASKTQTWSSTSCPKCGQFSSNASTPSSSQDESDSRTKTPSHPSTKVKALLQNIAKDNSTSDSEPGTPPRKW